MINNTNPQADVDGMVALGVLELLLSPEYSGSWLRELSTEFGVLLTSTDEELLDEAITRTLDQLAIPFVESLPEALRGPYMKTLEERELMLHPERKAVGGI